MKFFRKSTLFVPIFLFFGSLVQAAGVSFHHIPSLQQTEIAGHGLYCGYYALFNAARFARQMPAIVAAHPAAARAAVFAPLVSDRKSFDPALTRWEARVALHRTYLKKASLASLRAFGELEMLSAAELEDIICPDGEASVLGDLKRQGQLVIFGSLGDLDDSIGLRFTMDRLGSAMIALQSGQPVGFVICLDQERATSSCVATGGGGFQHWVAVGLQRTDAGVDAYTMDSAGNSFSGTLQTRLQRIVTFMCTQNPYHILIQSQLLPRCTYAFEQIIANQAALTPAVVRDAELIASWFKPTVAELHGIPGFDDIARGCVLQAAESVVGVDKAFKEAYSASLISVLTRITAELRAPARVEVIDLTLES